MACRIGEHSFGISLDDRCVETIKRLTGAPGQNDPALVEAARDRVVVGGRESVFEPYPGELVRVTCAKCGEPAILSLGWNA